MNSRKTVFIKDMKACVDYTIATLGEKIVLAMPLALGKSHAFANEMYRRAKADPEIQPLMATALSLEKPTASSELERRMLGHIVDRIWKGVPDFEYMLDLRAGRMPANATLKEFYFRPVLSILQQCGFFKSHLRYENFGIRNNETWYAVDLARDEDNRQAIPDHCIGDRLTSGIICHGSFFIGTNRFYEYLRRMSDKERKQFIMTGVAYVNRLYGDETIKRLQHEDGRFINAGMKVALMGHVVSDALENGTVISGVGGQYSFVSMAHALEDARSILMMRSTKNPAHGVDSNVVFNYAATPPSRGI